MLGCACPLCVWTWNSWFRIAAWAPAITSIFQAAGWEKGRIVYFLPGRLWRLLYYISLTRTPSHCHTYLQRKLENIIFSLCWKRLLCNYIQPFFTYLYLPGSNSLELTWQDYCESWFLSPFPSSFFPLCTCFSSSCFFQHFWLPHKFRLL